MMRHFRLLAFTIIVLIVPAMASGQEVNQAADSPEIQAAAAAFPPDLRFIEKPSSEYPYDTCAAVFTRNADGTSSLIAAAYSGNGAEIAMLGNGPGGTKIISAITNQQYWLTFGECELQIINLADPEQPDSPLAKTVNATFNGPDWLFIWDGKTLQNITALLKDPYYWRGKAVPNSAMYSANVVDVDHRGPMQIIGNNESGDKFPDSDGIAATPTLTLFRYNGRTYTAVKTLLKCKEFEPNWPKSQDEQEDYQDAFPRWTTHIDVHQLPTSNYQLMIVNGDRDGSNRVTSAKVEVNGLTIVQPTEVNQNTEIITRTIQLQKENEIKVLVDGPAQSHIYVIVE